MLTFIGLGLHDAEDLTLRGLKEARSCDLLFLEEYTSILSGAEKGDIEKVVRQSVRLLKREDIENREAIILEPAQKKKSWIANSWGPSYLNNPRITTSECKRTGNTN